MGHVVSRSIALSPSRSSLTGHGVVSVSSYNRSRYLLVKRGPMDTPEIMSSLVEATSLRPILAAPPSTSPEGVLVCLDPDHPIVIGQNSIRIPEPHARISTLLAVIRDGYYEDEYDQVDKRIFADVEATS